MMSFKSKMVFGIATLLIGVASTTNVCALCTSLDYAAWDGNLEKVKTECERNPEAIFTSCDGKTPLHYAVERGHEDVARYMVQCLKSHSECVGKNGETALHLAASYGDLDVCKSLVNDLINSGANVHAKDNDGNTPLHYAKGIETVKCLVEHGAMVNARNFWEQTPLLIGDLWENRKLNLEIIKYLERSGADLKAKDLFGNTLLMYAVRCEDLEVVKYLVENDADVNVKRYTGETPLELAVSCGNLDIVKCLVEHGADVNVKTSRGIPMVCCTKNLTVARYLVKHNVEIDPEAIGRFLLGNLRELDFDRFQYYLVELSADINVKNESGWTLLGVAINNCAYYRNCPYHIDNREALRVIAKEKVEFLRSRGAKE